MKLNNNYKGIDMKAYMVFSGNPCDGCILVYAESQGKAKSISHNALFEWDYIECQARRAKGFDKYYSGVSIIDCNEDLPKGAPKFYTEE